MDRTADLLRSLPNWLSQDYGSWSLTVVDYSSQDGLAGALPDRLAKVPGGGSAHLVRLPRPEYWSHARAGNACLRYGLPSELVFVLSTDTEFADTSHLSRIVESFLAARDADGAWLDKWRRDDMKYGPLKAAPPLPAMALQHQRVYCHTFGGIYLAERAALCALGGYNEFLTDWGYEDTDLLMRLELCGFGRIVIEGMKLRETPARQRTAHLQDQDPDATWHRNRRLSDRFISTVGLVPPLPWYPGREQWVELDGVRYEGWRAPQQRLPLVRSMRFVELDDFFAYRNGLRQAHMGRLALR